MAQIYPLSLDLRGRRCVVVGGGKVAERKAGGLLAAGASVTVVAPEATPELRSLAQRGELRWLARGFVPSDLDGAALAFVATSDPEVNQRAADAARDRRIWLNAAETAGECDFHVPAVLRRGPVTIAVSTAGASPTLSAWVRNRVEREIPVGIEKAAQVLDVLRRCRPREPLTVAGASRELLEAGLVQDLGREDWGAADEKVSRFFLAAPLVREIVERSTTEKP